MKQITRLNELGSVDPQLVSLFLLYCDHFDPEWIFEDDDWLANMKKEITVPDTDDSDSYICYNGKEPVGLQCFYVIGEESHANGIYVLEHLRGKGIATMLREQMYCDLFRKGIRELHLSFNDLPLQPTGAQKLAQSEWQRYEKGVLYITGDSTKRCCYGLNLAVVQDNLRILGR